MLKDYFPGDKIAQNTLLMVVDEGILEDMQGKNCINKFQMLGYIKGIVNDYGVSEQVAKTAIMNWAKALGIDAEDVPVSQEKNASSIKIQNDSVDYSESSIDDFTVNGKIIKFSGARNKIMPNVVLSGKAYIVKSTGKPTVKFFDSNSERD